MKSVGCLMYCLLGTLPERCQPQIIFYLALVGLEGQGRSPFCWINKSIIKSELIKDKGVESGRVQ